VAALAILGIIAFALSGNDEAPPPVATPTAVLTPSEEPTSEEPDTPDGPAMPRDAVGRERADVVEELNARGLSVRWALVRSGAPEGSVVGTFPRPGESMERGETAVIIVSRGQLPDGVESIDVPDGLVGSTADAASATLQSAQLRFSTAPIPSDAPAGTVIGSWPATGEPATDGVVVLVVSDGPADSDSAGSDEKSDDKGGDGKKKKDD
jgi:serine/threonine-protein kinase